MVAVPLMLSAAGHAKGDIPAALARERARHPGLTWTYGRPLGPHPALLELLAARIAAVSGPGTPAVLLVGRGSTDPDANADVVKTARLLWEGRDYPLAETAFVSLARPDVTEGLERCRLLGARQIVVARYFLFPGVLPDRVAEQAAGYAAAHPGLDIRCADVFGDCDEIAALVCERYQEALSGDIRMNCDVCVYRIAMPGFEHRVGEPQHPHDHPHDHVHDFPAPTRKPAPMTEEEPMDPLADVLAAIAPPDAEAMAAARERQDRMTKPRGSLGALEEVSVRLAGLAGSCPPPLPEPACVAVFAADHGVHAQGVTPWPQEVTAQMVANFLAGGAVVNAFAAQAGAEVTVIDIGVAADLEPAGGLLPRKVGRGTADFTHGPAMTREQAMQALVTGLEVARDLVAAGNRCLVTGDMGIANTTASAALICAFTGADPADATGRGTGIDAATYARKIDVVSPRPGPP